MLLLGSSSPAAHHPQMFLAPLCTRCVPCGLDWDMAREQKHQGDSISGASPLASEKLVTRSVLCNCSDLLLLERCVHHRQLVQAFNFVQHSWICQNHWRVHHLRPTACTSRACNQNTLLQTPLRACLSQIATPTETSGVESQWCL